MKTKIFFAAAILTVAVSAAGFLGTMSKASDENMLDTNVEALATGEEPSDCHYTNGYTSFKNDRGGAYDCCMIWHDLAPASDFCR